MDRRHFLGLSAALVAQTVAAEQAQAQLVRKFAEDLKNGEFNWFPERSADGPMLMIVSVPDQKVHVYRNGIRVAASTCSTGKPGHGTPTGVFKILQKDKNHRSSTYNNAPMPNMNRLTWSGVALHAGHLPGYPASHGCVRLPLKFSEMLFGITKLGMTVVIADDKSFPSEVAHPGLILGDAARRQFGAVNATLVKTSYAEGHLAPAKQTSVLISAPDKTIRVFEDGRVIAKGKVQVRDSDRPVANKAYVLQGRDPERQELKWSTVSFGKEDREDTTTELQRFETDPKLRDLIRQRTQQGMTIVTTNERAPASTRSKGKFVVIDSLY